MSKYERKISRLLSVSERLCNLPTHACFLKVTSVYSDLPGSHLNETVTDRGVINSIMISYLLLGEQKFPLQLEI